MNVRRASVGSWWVFAVALTVVAGGCSKVTDFDRFQGSDASLDARADGCGPEVCNGEDDDCDGTADEDFDLMTDPNNCGTCGHACDSGACIDGTCAPTCPAQMGDCNGSPLDCETDLTTTDNCGGCNVRCPSGQVCDATTDPATCSDTCPSGADNCDGTCTNTDTDPNNCRGCGIRCPDSPNALRGCNAAQGCTLSCRSGWDDCNTDLGQPQGDGCESDITSPLNCGMCGNGCDLDHAIPGCVDGSCTTSGCLGSWLNCNSGTPEDTDGCETDGSTLANCGTCRNECVSAPHAVTSCMPTMGCQYACDDGWADCNNDLGQPGSDGCESSLSDPATCGDCDTQCATDQACGDDGSGNLACIMGCVPPTPEMCGDSCVNTQTDPKYCGDCDTACTAPPNATATCDMGVCGFQCQPGYADCTSDPGCETQLGTTSDCTTCSDSCTFDHASGECGVDGCDFTCKTGFEDCNGLPGDGCERSITTASDCGSCDHTCTLDHATAGCTAGSMGNLSCSVAMCAMGWGNCNGSPGDGCEEPLNTLTNCGKCGQGCSVDHGTATCASGSCQIAPSGCDPGYADCMNGAADGCETRIDTTSNCGGCGLGCTALPNAAASCAGASGPCQYECQMGYADCNMDLGMPGSDGCESDLSAAATCGTCSNTCSGGTPVCSNGSCVSGCPSGQTRCGDSCVDTNTSTSNCGMCAHSCPSPANATAKCSGGTCDFDCLSGYDDCTSDPGCETPLGTDSDCASCGDACSYPNASATCSSGSCSFQGCDTGWGDCVNGLADGCETPTNTNMNCGSCGNSCGAVDHGATTCNGTQCVVSTCTGDYADCNGMAADGCEELKQTYYLDADGDGWGKTSSATLFCMNAVPGNYVQQGGDCNDGNPNVHPMATELCNGADDNCNGLVDETWPNLGTACTCEAGAASGTVVCTSDKMGTRCAYPAEVCNGRDDDCAGGKDDAFACVQGSTTPCTWSGSACSVASMKVCGSMCTFGSCLEPAEQCNRTDDDCDGFLDENIYRPVDDVEVDPKADHPEQLRGAYSPPAEQFGMVWHDGGGRGLEFGLATAKGEVIVPGGAIIDGPISSDVCWDGFNWVVVYSQDLGGGDSKGYLARYSSKDGTLIGSPIGLKEAPPVSLLGKRTGPKQVRCAHVVNRGEHFVGVVWTGVENGNLGPTGFYTSYELFSSKDTSIGQTASTVDLEFSSKYQLRDPAIVGASDQMVVLWSSTQPGGTPGSDYGRIHGTQFDGASGGGGMLFAESEIDDVWERNLELGFDADTGTVELGYTKDNKGSLAPYVMRWRLGDAPPPTGNSVGDPAISNEPAWAADRSFGHLLGAPVKDLNLLRLESPTGDKVGGVVRLEINTGTRAFPIGVPAGVLRYGILWTDGGIVHLRLIGC